MSAGTNQGQINERRDHVRERAAAPSCAGSDVSWSANPRPERLNASVEAVAHGHLVSPRCTRNSAVGSITRLIDMASEPYIPRRRRAGESSRSGSCAPHLHPLRDRSRGAGRREALFGDKRADRCGRPSAAPNAAPTGFLGPHRDLRMVRMTQTMPRARASPAASEHTLLATARRTT